MNIRNAALGNDRDPQVSIAAAMKAVQAAQAALESAYVNLMAVASGLTPPRQRSEDPTLCEHPLESRQEIASMGRSVTMCFDCGVEVSDE